MLLVIAGSGIARAQPTAEVTMRLSSDRILLGEPVWVLLTARNTSAVRLKLNPGSRCSPVTTVVPEAAPADRKPERCGSAEFTSRSGSIPMIVLAPGASVTERFLVEGDFHFTRAGTYRLVVTSHPSRAYEGRGADTTAVTAAVVSTTQTLVLVVTPPDPKALLAREQQIEDNAEEESAASAHQGPDAAILRGLAAQPAPGMEAVLPGGSDRGRRTSTRLPR